MEENLTSEVKRVLLEQELARWKQEQYTLEIRFRVNTKIGTPPEGLVSLKTALEQCEKAIDVLKEELKSLK